MANSASIYDNVFNADTYATDGSDDKEKMLQDLRDRADDSLMATINSHRTNIIDSDDPDRSTDYKTTSK